MRLVLLLLAALASGCLPALPRAEMREGLTFDPVAFFEGRTVGLGVLDVRGAAPDSVHVESVGARVGNGLRLHQTIRLGDREPSERTWELHRTGPATYEGTLTDARRRVDATVDGSQLTIHFRMGLVTTATQRLTLEPGGRVALNRMTVRVLGIPWARLTERIRRVDDYSRSTE